MSEKRREAPAPGSPVGIGDSSGMGDSGTGPDIRDPDAGVNPLALIASTSRCTLATSSFAYRAGSPDSRAVFLPEIDGIFTWPQQPNSKNNDADTIG